MRSNLNLIQTNELPAVGGRVLLPSSLCPLIMVISQVRGWQGDLSDLSDLLLLVSHLKTTLNLLQFLLLVIEAANFLSQLLLLGVEGGHSVSVSVSVSVAIPVSVPWETLPELTDWR